MAKIMSDFVLLLVVEDILWLCVCFVVCLLGLRGKIDINIFRAPDRVFS